MLLTGGVLWMTNHFLFTLASYFLYALELRWTSRLAYVCAHARTMLLAVCTVREDLCTLQVFCLNCSWGFFGCSIRSASLLHKAILLCPLSFHRQPHGNRSTHALLAIAWGLCFLVNHSVSFTVMLVSCTLEGSWDKNPVLLGVGQGSSVELGAALWEQG